MPTAKGISSQDGPAGILESLYASGKFLCPSNTIPLRDFLLNIHMNVDAEAM